MLRLAPGEVGWGCEVGMEEGEARKEEEEKEVKRE